MDYFTPPSTPQKKRASPRVSRSSLDSIPFPTTGYESPQKGTDRYIPNRASFDVNHSSSLLFKDDTQIDNNLTGSNSTSPKKNKYYDELQEITNNNKDKRLIDCFEKNESIFYSPRTSLKRRENLHLASPASPKSIARSIPSGPCRILDAPEIVDDYYLNLLSWGSHNVIAVALKKSVYLWHAIDGRIINLLGIDDDAQIVTSVNWSPADQSLAVGTSNNNIQLWDPANLTMIRTLTGHTNRVSSLSWNPSSPNVLSSGSRDSSIINHDVRMNQSMISTLNGHNQEVCGLAWSPDGSSLASGGNENLLCIWDAASSGIGNGTRNSSSSSDHTRDGPKFSIDQHTAAVKAVSWCPWSRYTLASGGGTADRTIRMWNTHLGTASKCVDTGSQVCSIQWSDAYKELVSSHGFSDNQLILWKYPSMTKVKEFRGHTSRVLHLAKSPDGTTICSASADETIRFWELFGANTSRKSGSVFSSHAGAGSTALSQGLQLR